jgi:hypothetical protein
VVLRDSLGKVVWDDGERLAENNYIGACINAGNVEALYYALCRKRARLEREGHEKAAGSFAKVWGGWLAQVEESLSGHLSGFSAPALPEAFLAAQGGEKEADADAGDDGEVAMGTISEEEWEEVEGEDLVAESEGGKGGAPGAAAKPAAGQKAGARAGAGAAAGRAARGGGRTRGKGGK